MTRSKRILKTVVADSQNLFRRGLATVIRGEADMEVLGEASSAAQAFEIIDHVMVNKGAVDVLVMDMSLVRGDEELVKAARKLPESLAILLLAHEESEENLNLTVATGARGYIMKSN